MRVAACHPARPYVARGYCRNCYMLAYRGKNPALPPRARERKEWDSQEIAQLKKDYSTLSREQLLKLLAPRTWSSIQDMASKLLLVRTGALKGRRRWKLLAANHTPVFVLPIDVPVKYRRPWS